MSACNGCRKSTWLGLPEFPISGPQGFRRVSAPGPGQNCYRTGPVPPRKHQEIWHKDTNSGRKPRIHKIMHVKICCGSPLNMILVRVRAEKHCMHHVCIICPSALHLQPLPPARKVWKHVFEIQKWKQEGPEFGHNRSTKDLLTLSEENSLILSGHRPIV